MLHFVTSYMTPNKSRKQTLESAHYGLEIIFIAVNPKVDAIVNRMCSEKRYLIRSHSEACREKMMTCRLRMLGATNRSTRDHHYI